MKVFYESKLAKWLLWQGYNTITLGCFVFTKKSKEEMKQSTLNHEAIHVRQWEECMIASAVLLTVIMLFGYICYARCGSTSSMVWSTQYPTCITYAVTGVG